MLPSSPTALLAVGVLEFGRQLPSLLPPHPAAAVRPPVAIVTTAPPVVGSVLAAYHFLGATAPRFVPAALLENIGAIALSTVLPWPNHTPLPEMMPTVHSSPL